MKRFFLLLLAMLMAGCTPNTPAETNTEEPLTIPGGAALALTANPMYNMPDLPEGYTVLTAAADRIYPWNGLYYTLSVLPDVWEIGACSADGQTYTPLYTADTMVHEFFVGKSGIFLLRDGGIITHLDHKGAVLGTYATACDYTDEVQRSMHVQLCADDTHLILSWWTGAESSRDESGIIAWTYPVTVISLADGSRTELMLDEYVMSIALWDGSGGDFALIQPSGAYMDYGYTLYSECTVSRLDPESGKLTQEDSYHLPYLPDLQYNPADGRVYYNIADKISASEYAYSEKGSDGIRRIRTLREDTRYQNTIAAVGENAERPTNNWTYYTGYDIILYDSKNHCTAVLNLPSAENEVLTLLIPHNKYTHIRDSDSRITEALSREITAFEAETGAYVDCLTYPADELVERLRMKMLAGENDFDVVYYDTKYDNFTAALLNYGLFLPLEESKIILENFENYMDGVQEIMTYGGHLYGVPRSIKASAVFIGTEYRMAGLPQIDTDWTAEDFWNVCEAALTVDDKLGDGALDGLYFLLEQGLQSGKMDEDAIAAYLTAQKKYTNAGVFSGDSQFPLLDTLMLSPSLVKNLTSPKFSGKKIVPLPAANGTRYASADTFLFINSRTENRELALKYLELMSSPEIAGELVTGRSTLLKDPSLYYEITGGLSLDLSWKDYEKTTPEDLEALTVICEALETVLRGSSPYVYILDDEFPAEVSQIRQAVIHGTLTPEEGAKKLSYAARYRYLE